MATNKIVIFRSGGLEKSISFNFVVMLYQKMLHKIEG